VYTVQQTATFAKWLTDLRDPRARARIIARIQMVGLGHFGDVKPVGEGVSEMRVDVGPGYRLYYARRRAQVILLLCGGDKSSQQRDIKRAIAMVRTLEDEL
jgi:putative addiction module killer protein